RSRGFPERGRAPRSGRRALPPPPAAPARAGGAGGPPLRRRRTCAPGDRARAAAPAPLRDRTRALLLRMEGGAPTRAPIRAARAADRELRSRAARRSFAVRAGAIRGGRRSNLRRRADARGR